jgi:outer membrane protein TolC
MVAGGIPADLVRRRPDIRAARTGSMAQSAQIGIAEATSIRRISLPVGRGKMQSGV